MQNKIINFTLLKHAKRFLTDHDTNIYDMFSQCMGYIYSPNLMAQSPFHSVAKSFFLIDQKVRE